MSQLNFFLEKRTRKGGKSISRCLSRSRIKTKTSTNEQIMSFSKMCPKKFPSHASDLYKPITRQRQDTERTYLWTSQRKRNRPGGGWIQQLTNLVPIYLFYFIYNPLFSAGFHLTVAGESSEWLTDSRQRPEWNVMMHPLHCMDSVKTAPHSVEWILPVLWVLVSIA